MKKFLVFLLFLILLATASGCSSEGKNSIPFTEEQLYAVAYLGYNSFGNLDFYVQQYLDGYQPGHFYFSEGDCYLIIPRYDDMQLMLFHNDMETSQHTLVYMESAGKPFVLQCNESDIFADATVRFLYNETAVEFSPFISLKDGTLQVGEAGLNITKDPVDLSSAS